MGDGVFNIARGRVGYYGTLPVANDALIVVLLRGVQGDATLADHTTLSSVLGSNTECNFTNYVRKTVTSVTVTVNNANDISSIDIADQIWTSAGGATNNTIVKAVVGYDNDTTSGTDANIVPMLYFDVGPGTTDGNNVTWQINDDGLWRSESP